MHGLDLIQDFAILLLAAGIAGLLCKRAGLSVVVGYLVAGVIIGPHTPPFSLIVDEDRIMALSQVGLVFLMFGIGLGLSLSKFARLGAGTLVATGLGAAGVLLLTEIMGTLIGWTPLQAMFVAAMLMVSSSAVIAKVVSEQNRTHEPAAQTAIAVTVLEDVVAVAMLTILASQTQTREGGTDGVGALLGGLSAFVALLAGAGLLLVPRLLRRLETKAESEMQTVVVAGVLFALALTAAKAGYSIALGAFLFGAIVAEIPQKLGVEASFRGLREMFSSVFFVSIGMMIDLSLLREVWPMVLGLTVFTLVARPFACGLALIAVGHEPGVARRASLLLTPLGEFSYIIAQLGVTTAILPATFYPVAVGASILTLLATPTMSRYSEQILRLAQRAEPRFVGRALDAYHAWFTQLRDRPARTPLWRLVRPRLGQSAVEILFVSGLLIYSEALLAAVADSAVLRGVESTVTAYVYWSIVTLLVLVPLVAIWRNFSALSLMMAQAWGTPRLPRPAIERVLKSAAAVGLASWLFVLLPHARFAQWGWVALGLGAAAVATVFSRRLIFWHSHLQNSVREVLADRRADAAELRVLARAELGRSLNDWRVSVSDATIPAGGAAAGKTLAELALPDRFRCAVIEIERNNRVLRELSGDFAVYPGDRLLLVGAPDQLAVAQELIEQRGATAEDDATLAATVLDTCRAADWQAGRSLAELGIAGHTGVRIVGIQRGVDRIVNPSAAERLQAGDELLVLGTLEQIRSFKRWRPTIAPVAEQLPLPVPITANHA